MTYFLRVDPEYGIARTGPALEASYKTTLTLVRDDPDACYQGTMLVDMALFRNPPELKPFIASAVSDPRPLVAAGGARAFATGNVALIQVQPLIARMQKLHDDWRDSEAKKNTGDPSQPWNSDCDALERMIVWALVNINDNPDHAAAWKEAYDLCVTDGCRKSLRQRMDRSRF